MSKSHVVGTRPLVLEVTELLLLDLEIRRSVFAHFLDRVEGVGEPDELMV